MYEFTVCKAAYDAILQSKKTVEIRRNNNRSFSKGDFIRFDEWKGNRNMIAIIDKEISFKNFENLNQYVSPNAWQFEPQEECDELIRNEFKDTNYEGTLSAIFIHMPKVSIIMPCKSSASILEQTLISLSNQSFKDYELICVDDGLDDNAQAILSGFKDTIPLRIFKNDKGMGAAWSRNFGFENANGEIIVFLDSDDLFERRYIEECVKALEYPGCDVAICEYDSFDDEKILRRYNDEHYIENEKTFTFKWSKRNYSWYEIPENMLHLTNMPWNKAVKKSFLIKTGIRFQDLKSSNDVYWGHMIMLKGKSRHTELLIPLVHYRVSQKSSVSYKVDPFCVQAAYNHIFNECEKMGIKKDYKLVDDYYYAIINALLKSDNENRASCFKLLMDVENSQRLFTDENFRKRHHKTIEIYKTLNSDIDLSKVKPELIDILYNQKERIRDYLQEFGEHPTVALIRNGYNEQYVISELHDLNIKWIIGESFGDERPDVILSITPRQYPDVVYYKEKNRFLDSSILELFSIGE